MVNMPRIPYHDKCTVVGKILKVSKTKSIAYCHVCGAEMFTWEEKIFPKGLEYSKADREKMK